MTQRISELLILTSFLLLAIGCGSGGEDAPRAESSTADGASSAQASSPVSAAVSGGEVVIYCALDQIFSEPLLKQFEAQSGIRVKAVFDVEASKTIGLVNRLIAEKNAPVCDVFWNNEILQTLVLKEQGLLAPYESPAAAAIPAAWKDPEGCWAGFAARARVIIVNTKLMPDEAAHPAAMADFLDPRHAGKAAIANPLFGTTSTHAAAMFAAWGPERAQKFFGNLKANKVAVLAGNATVRDLVTQGEYAFGLTDTDDAVGAIESGKPVRMIFHDQAGEGALLIPNTVALIAGAPHPEAAKKLIDFILSPEVEQALAGGRSAQIPLRPGMKPPKHIPPGEELKFQQIDFTSLLRWREPSVTFIRENFLTK